MFVLLEGPYGNRFFTTHTDGDEHDGYKVLGHADTVEEAQDKLYGKEFMNRLREIDRGAGGDGHV